MNRTTLGYFLMAVFSAGILWGILRIGSGLKAPPDWSGEWETVSADGTPRRVTIQQSGVYFHIRTDNHVDAYKLEWGYGWMLKGSKRTWNTRGILGDGSLPLSDYATATHLMLRRARATDATH
jgi:hypothetical protein